MAKRELILLGVILCVVLTGPWVWAEEYVITKRGTMFHHEDCPLIQKNETRAIGLQEAGEKGIRPCSVCLKEFSINVLGAPPTSIAVSKEFKFMK